MKIISRNSRFTSLPRTMIMIMIVSVLAVAPSALAATGTEKTGLVDTQKVLDQMPEKKKAENILKATGTQWQKGLDKLKNDFQTAATNYEKQKKSLSKTALEQKEKDLNLKYQSIQKYQLEKFGPGGALEKKQNELFAPIRQKFLTAVQTVAKKEGYSVIIDKQAVVYGDKSADITFKVIDQLK
ncbi:OmpH family outer membrane protein [Prosthecochloris sp.]|uniref:OmpH family outer membrane protein n=1 Tax=Prosthecochloris sp. TaxID=290513 RepID=UPI0025F291BB|nr:OmpH family outer membrane protein [Prosthecochloris sp.]